MSNFTATDPTTYETFMGRWIGWRRAEPTNA
jgi:hypothetical protein